MAGAEAEAGNKKKKKKRRKDVEGPTTEKKKLPSGDEDKDKVAPALEPSGTTGVVSSSCEPKPCVATASEEAGTLDGKVENTRDQLAQRLAATTKELLRLQLGAKARMLDQLRHSIRGRRSAATKFAVRALPRQPAAAARAVLPVSSSAPSSVKVSTASLAQQRTETSLRSPPLPSASLPQPVQKPLPSTQLRGALQGIVQEHQNKVMEERRKLEAAIAKRQMLAAAGNKATGGLSKSTDSGAASGEANSSTKRTNDGKTSQGAQPPLTSVSAEAACPPRLARSPALWEKAAAAVIENKAKRPLPLATSPAPLIVLDDSDLQRP